MNWALNVNALLCQNGFAYIWENQYDVDLKVVIPLLKHTNRLFCTKLEERFEKKQCIDAV